MAASAVSPLYNFYFRYKWSHLDFSGLQTALITLQRDMLGALAGPSLLNGGVVAPSGSTRAVTVQAYVAINSDGYLNVSPAVALATVTANSSGNPRKDLIVARPLLVDGTLITRPTSPFDTVPLTTLQQTQIVVIPGTPAGSPAYPAKVAGDVILAGVSVANGATSFSGGDLDTTVTELISTNTNFSNWVVAKTAHGTVDIQGDATAAVVALNVKANGNNMGALILDAHGTGIGLQIITGGSQDVGIDMDGWIDMDGASDPAATTGITNTLTPKGIPKAWARVRCDSPVTLQNGLNIDAVSYSGNYLFIDLQDALSSVNAVAIAGLENSDAEIAIAEVVSTTRIRVSIYNPFAANFGASPVSLNTSDRIVSLVVYGEQ